MVSVQYIYDLNNDWKNEIGWGMWIPGASFKSFRRSENQILGNKSFNIRARPLQQENKVTPYIFTDTHAFQVPTTLN